MRLSAFIRLHLRNIGKGPGLVVLELSTLDVYNIDASEFERTQVNCLCLPSKFWRRLCYCSCSASATRVSMSVC